MGKAAKGLAEKDSTTKADLDTFWCIVWCDAVTAQGWEAHDEAHEVHECRSVGWLIKETKKEIVLAADISLSSAEEDGTPTEVETNRRIAIPKSWILSRKKVKFGAG